MQTEALVLVLLLGSHTLALGDPWYSASDDNGSEGETIHREGGSYSMDSQRARAAPPSPPPVHHKSSAKLREALARPVRMAEVVPRRPSKSSKPVMAPVGVAAVAPALTEEGPTKDPSRLMEDLLRGYDKRDRPNIGGEAVTIHTGATIEQVTRLDEGGSIAYINFVLRVLYVDPRLAFTAADYGITNDTHVHWNINDIWTPPVVCVNQASAFVSDEFALGYYDGRVYFSRRYVAKTYQSFNVMGYPFDQQRLRILLAVTSMSARDIEMKVWARKTRLRTEYFQYYKDMNPQIVLSRVWGEAREDKTSIVVSISTSRQYRTLLTKAVLPIFLVNLGSYATLFMEPPTSESPHTAPRPAAITVMFLTMLTYSKMIVRHFVPDSESWTLFDWYILTQQMFTIIILISLTVHFIVIRVTLNRYPKHIMDAEAGLRTMDKALALLLPIAYGVCQLIFIACALYLLYT